jgi:hypothetical protein
LCRPVWISRLMQLAIRRGLALATLDDKLKTAAQTVGVLFFGVH